MRKTIAIGMLGFSLVANGAAAQTAVEQAEILRDFQRSVVDYAQRDRCPVFPQAVRAATPAPVIFTLPVAMVFRQSIAKVLATADGPAIGGVGTVHRARLLEPFPANELHEFTKLLRDALPPLPPPLEYRLIGNDLAIRDGEADLIVAVLRDALGTVLTR